MTSLSNPVPQIFCSPLTFSNIDDANFHFYFAMPLVHVRIIFVNIDRLNEVLLAPVKAFFFFAVGTIPNESRPIRRTNCDFFLQHLFTID
jgi:hypothetical protein